MPGAIAYLLERERLQEPFKVTLQVSNKGLKIIQTVHPGGSTRSAVKHLVPGHAVLATIQREDVVAATLLLPNPATNTPVHVHAYRCDSIETAELLGGQLKALASHTDNLARVTSVEGRLRNNLGSDGRSTRESESSEGSGELRHDPAQTTTTIYESLAAELRAKLGRGISGDNDVGPILLPPRDYDTVHRHRGNLAGIEFRRCQNQTIVGGNTSVVDRGGTKSATSSGIGSDCAATPPPYQNHHSLGPRPSRPSRDSSSDDDWGAPVENNNEYIPEQETTGSNLTLPRLARSPERISFQVNRGASSSYSRNRRAPEFRQRSPSPQYQPRANPGEGLTSPRERFQDAKEMFRAMEREATSRTVASRQRDVESHPIHRIDSSRQIHVDCPNRQNLRGTNSATSPAHEYSIRRNHLDILEREHNISYRGRPRPRTHYYEVEQPLEQEISRSRPRNFYENPTLARDFRDQRNLMDSREIRDFGNRAHIREIHEKVRARATTYQELTEHERYPGLDRESARPSVEIVPSPSRYRHSYAEPLRLGLAALNPY
ncbi:hypothetical protein KM043_008054 [Ampulex compressa]|nr:hypothetical protein KM043_008054 [Ampulex compressa]